MGRAGGVRGAGGGGGARGPGGGGVAGVAGRAAGRHGERVGCGAALPVIFWRSPGRAAGLTLGGVVLTVNGDRDVVERQLAGGELACPKCGGVLGGWGHGRLRRIRLLDGPEAELVPFRSRCAACKATHVLLPAWCLLRRADASEVVGAALAAAAAGRGHRSIARVLGRPPSTVRGWLRRLAGRAEPVRVFFTVLLARTAPDPVMPAGAASPGAAAAAASGGLLLAPGWPAGGGNTN